LNVVIHYGDTLNSSSAETLDDDQHATHRRLERSAVADKNRLWPNGIVYYSISDGFTG